MTISDLASVHPEARIADDVSIGPFTVVAANVELGAGSSVGSHCVLGQRSPLADPPPLRVGPDSRIRSHSVLYEGSSFASRLETGHHTVLREGLMVGHNLRVGTFADLQGDTTIGDYARCHSGVFVAKFSALGDFTWMFPGSALTNDPHPPSNVQLGGRLDDYAVLGAYAVVLPGIRLGEGSVAAAGAVVTRDVPPGELVVGAPAKRTRSASQVRLRGEPSGTAYPWRRHFRRGYPDDVTARWDDEGA